MNRIPVPEARELPDDEAWRELFDTFGMIDEPATEPMPLFELEPLPDERFLERVREVFGVHWPQQEQR